MTEEPAAPDDGDENGADGATDRVTEERAARLEEKERRLASQEESLTARERELDQRATRLDERERDLADHSEQLANAQQELEQRDTNLAEREESLEERTTSLRERQQELNERAAELDRKEATLEEYVGERVSELEGTLAETVRENVERAVADIEVGGRSALGVVAGVLLALLGVVLVATGVANAFDTTSFRLIRLAQGETANLAISTALVVLGTAATLAAASGRG